MITMRKFFFKKNKSKSNCLSNVR
uniref:Uncharacterized protein n=1 Tax=Anguilla anguilla TaxID=7936 RepID=A0A0E9WBY9_ANGAN